jgi:hypothetical protein
LKITNHDSTITLPPSVTDFAADVIAKYDNQRVRSAYDPGRIADLLNEIPVLLVNEASHAKVDGDTDLLGFYTEDATVLGISGPAIGLCPERIKEHTRDSDRDFMYLVTIVLIHEFAHALMGMTPQSKKKHRNGVYRSIEEPLANMITLQYLASYDDATGTGNPSTDNPYTYARQFMQSHQPTHYSFGVKMYDLGIHEWWLWRSQKAVITGWDNSTSAPAAEVGNRWMNMACKSEAANSGPDVLSDVIRSTWWQLVGRGQRPEGLTAEDMHAAYNILFSAITDTDHDALKEAVKTPYLDVGIEDKAGKTALHRALATNDCSVARRVFEHDLDTALRLFPEEAALCAESQSLSRNRTWLPDNMQRIYKTHQLFGIK